MNLSLNEGFGTSSTDPRKNYQPMVVRFHPGLGFATKSKSSDIWSLYWSEAPGATSCQSLRIQTSQLHIVTSSQLHSFLIRPV